MPCHAMPLTSHASAWNIEIVMAIVLIAQQANTACALIDMQKINDLSVYVYVCVCVCKREEKSVDVML